MSSAAVTLLILAVVVVLFVWNRLPVGVVAVLTMLALWATGLVDTEQVLAGFGDPVVIFLATLFVVSEAIDATGVTTWLGQQIVDRAGTSRARLLTAVGLTGALLTALITLNGSVAALLPLVVVLAFRVGQPPSQMLMPLAFSGACGALLTLTGSPVNVIVSEAAEDAGAGPFPFFSFAVVGLPLLAGTLAICILLGPRLLPRREPEHAGADLGRYAQTLEEHYALTDGFFRVRVRERSPLLGRLPAELDLGDYPGVTLIGAQSPQLYTVTDRPLAEDDILVLTGPRSEVSAMTIELRLAVTMDGALPGDDQSDRPTGLLTREAGAVEVVVPPRSSLIGQEVFPGMRRAADLVILAVQRMGRDRGRRTTELAEGDALLLHGSWAASTRCPRTGRCWSWTPPTSSGGRRFRGAPRRPSRSSCWPGWWCCSRQAWYHRRSPAWRRVAALVLSRTVGVQQAYRAVSWETVVLIGGLIPLTTAIRTSGAADLIASWLIDAVGHAQPYLLLLALFVLTAVLGQIVSNTATVLIVTPIAVAAATATGTSVQPVLMLIAVAGSAALLTPIATPANMMVMNPGGYRFGDYWKLGLPVMAWWLVVGLVVIPLVWRF